ncbi:hypothetical protein [Criblamydia sequanensis]|uniref:Uncharacterized protein n=1 Tax=Candidatus Criblamydia sequanensis CRIB-18 TaxID=1437425 RepID=A0A090CXZ5_9BACT|nr:hypothetical protein [Criblamydia sequanensis]CDR33152.1 hypothetical protein CSEC_0313 [Criblamydia sequanensis CRIB-18]
MFPIDSSYPPVFYGTFETATLSLVSFPQNILNTIGSLARSILFGLATLLTVCQIKFLSDETSHSFGKALYNLTASFCSLYSVLNPKNALEIQSNAFTRLCFDLKNLDDVKIRSFIFLLRTGA